MITWLFDLVTNRKLIQRSKNLAQPNLTRHPANFSLRERAAPLNMTCMGGHAAPLEPTTKAKPLRIIQWIESTDSSHPRSHRVVMSGRMSDVCAELDRLVAMDGA